MRLEALPIHNIIRSTEQAGNEVPDGDVIVMVTGASGQVERASGLLALAALDHNRRFRQGDR